MRAYKRVSWQNIYLIKKMVGSVTIKKYGINLKTVARHSKKDEWFRKRCEYLSNVVRESQIKLHIQRCYDDVLDTVNEDRIAHGLEPWEKLSRTWERWLREEVEKLY